MCQSTYDQIRVFTLLWISYRKTCLQHLNTKICPLMGNQKYFFQLNFRVLIQSSSVIQMFRLRTHFQSAVEKIVFHTQVIATLSFESKFSGAFLLVANLSTVFLFQLESCFQYDFTAGKLQNMWFGQRLKAQGGGYIIRGFFLFAVTRICYITVNHSIFDYILEVLKILRQNDIFCIKFIF